MRSFGSLIEKAVKFREPQIPGARLERVRPPTVHRLDDGITELFDYACISNDLDAAAELMELLDKWHARRPYEDEEQRRAVGIQLKRMRGELDRRHLMRGNRPAAAVQPPERQPA